MLGGFGLVQETLPLLTMSPFWVKPLNLRPLPTFTTWRRGLGVDLGVGAVRWLGSRVIVIEGYNGGEPSTPSEVAHTVGKVSKRKFSERPVGL